MTCARASTCRSRTRRRARASRRGRPSSRRRRRRCTHRPCAEQLPPIGKCLTRPSTRSSSPPSVAATGSAPTRQPCLAHGRSPAPDPDADAFRRRAPRRSGSGATWSPSPDTAAAAAARSGRSLVPGKARQRGWNAQPGGGEISSAAGPGSASSRFLVDVDSARLFIRPIVYGWRGELKIVEHVSVLDDAARVHHDAPGRRARRSARGRG